MRIVTRSQWGAARPRSVTRSRPTALDGVVVHWFGKPRARRSHAECPAQLRAVQRAHMAGEFTDIAYGHAVCQHGVVFELRGFNRQTGANGNASVNRRFGAIVAMIGTGDKPTAALLTGLRAIRNEYVRRGAGKLVRTHGSITGSACPGPHLTSWVNRKGWLPLPKHLTRHAAKGGMT